ncbi:hypothetical protein IEU95_05500 [Hoyosella rhizosphaerae]|uniref:Uncharacterized protein n=1 Tax=Hoyosella rhizosphaerae TaxID=1755582 RepID=A0A916U7B9_9ACTN|nr:hypothetical protein [Hoyosella rhizosphaerae]MBN4926275.1 hypothetical protein [Hoyosella rhizosphaerae]GGC60678.1 hypothetical protein GCM10011410_11450 [Hoyosella rhizosphaerae]
METVLETVGDTKYQLRCGGDARNTAALIVTSADEPAEHYDALCTKLHNSGLRTITLTVGQHTTHADILELIDKAKAAWVHVAGIGTATTIAWEFAAHNFDRTASLTIYGGGHPAAVVGQDAAQDSSCPPVEVGTTIVATNARELAHAKASGQYVRGDLRIVTTMVENSASDDHLAILATEIVLRSNPW